MRPKSLLLLLLLTGCSRGPEADLQYVKQARTASAEWALVNKLARQDRLTNVYTGSMRKWLREEIQSASSALTQPDSRHALEMHALLDQPDDAAPKELRAHSERLKQIEDQLESA